MMQTLAGCPQGLDRRVCLIHRHMAFGGDHLFADLTPRFPSHGIQADLLDGLQLTAEAFEATAGLRHILPRNIAFNVVEFLL